ncbi:MAG: Ig-like domain-containing protein [Bryobacteraceae bacterium]
MRALLSLTVFCAEAFAAGVSVRFAPSLPSVGPYPTDFLSVPDPVRKTGLRVNLPLPDCAAQPSTCEEITLINGLDGFNLQPRIRVRFSGPINPDTLRAGVFFVTLNNLTDEEYGLQKPGDVTVINQVLYDPATNTAYAKPDAFLDQHRRYLLVVTDAVRDPSGDAVERDPAFDSCLVQVAESPYCASLAAALAAHPQSLGGRRVIAASLFTTHSATEWLEKARNALPNTALNVQRTGSRSVFAISDLASVTVRPQTRLGPEDPAGTQLPLAVLAGVGRVAFGSFRSPVFLNDSLAIAPPAGGEIALPPASAEIHFIAFLPATPPPTPAGYPAIIAGHGLNGSHLDLIATAATNARGGFVTIGIPFFGHGFGPGGKVVLAERNGSTTELSSGGRGLDIDRNGEIGAAEGCVLPGIRGAADCLKQTTVDLMQLTRALRVGIDLDGDAQVDLDGDRVFYTGASLGAIAGTVLAAAEPGVRAAVLNVGGGSFAELTRWSPTFRPATTANLALRRPSLLNRGAGFEEDYVLRYRPVKIVQTPGAVEIQEFFEFAEWYQASGDAVAFAPHLFSSTLSGVPIKPVLFQMAIGDRTIPNNTSTHLIRAANLRETTRYYRHDLARAVAPGLSLNPHAFIADPSSLHSIAIAVAAQTEAVGFLASDGAAIPDVNHLVRPLFGRDLFESPGFLTEDLNF